MTARDELAAIIEAGYGASNTDCPYDHAPEIADAILAAGYRKLVLSDATVERAAEAAALVDDEDGCFERIPEWEAMEDWEKEAQGYPSDDYEACEYWIKRTRAVLAAAVEEER